MNPTRHESTTKQKRYITSFSTFWLWLVSMTAQAQLPTPVDPSSGAPNGNYLAFMQGWSGDAIDYIALVISGAGFLWVGWILLSKFN